MKIRFWMSALVLALLGATAQAETNKNGFYLGSGAGVYYVDMQGVGLDKAAPTWRVFGGYTLNKYVSFEGGWTNMFKISDTIMDVNVDMDGSAFDVVARPTLPLGDRFEAFGIVGYSWYDWTIKAEYLGVTVEDSANDDDFLYGLGAAWNVTDRWSLRGEWTNVNVSDADFGMVTASVSYSFR